MNFFHSRATEDVQEGGRVALLGLQLGNTNASEDTVHLVHGEIGALRQGRETGLVLKQKNVL